jgi:TRAP-type C4-dicarboxylate transport system permease small subunit
MLLRLVLAAIMIGIVLLNVANIGGRYIFSAPIRGADEAMTFAMVWGVFLGAGLVTLRGAHLNMDLLVTLLPPALRRVAAALALVALLLILGFVATASLSYLETVGAIGLTSMSLGLPMAWVHAAVPAGCALMIAAALLRLLAPPA